jgi:hypothetical protein
MAPTKPTEPTDKTKTSPQTPDPAPGTGAGPQSLIPERDESVSLVCKLNKEALTAMLSGLDLGATGTVDELRRRLVKFLRDRAAETFVPSTQASASSVPMPTATPVSSVSVLPPERSSRSVSVQDWRLTFNGKRDPVDFLERVKPPPGSGTTVKGGVTGKVSRLTFDCFTFRSATRKTWRWRSVAASSDRPSR